MKKVSKVLQLICFASCVFSSVYGGYYSQCRQDEFFDKVVFKGKRNGVFIDIGAYDGKIISNSFYFEKELGWSGVCVEPVSVNFNKLRKCRSCICLQKAVTDFIGSVEFLWVESSDAYDNYNVDYEIDTLSGIFSEYHPTHLNRVNAHLLGSKRGGTKHFITVETTTFNTIMEENELLNVDFVSIDTEGGEFKIIKDIDFDKYQIEAFSIEVNYGESDIRDFLLSKGYVFARKLGCDEVFIREDLYNTLDEEEIALF